MKIAVDCRMSGKSGIGAFIDGILPYFIKSGNQLLLLGLEKSKLLQTFPDFICHSDNVSFLPCDIEIFSIKETFFFPKKLSKIINQCDAYFTPYCNIPSGIKIPVFSTIHDIVFLDMPELAGKTGTFIRKIFYRHAVSKSMEIMTVSFFSKERIIEQLHCKKNINVVYSALPEYLSKNNPQNLEQIRKDNSIIFIGNIKKHKGLKTLVESFTDFSATVQKTENLLPELVIVGSQENFRTSDNDISKLIEKIPENQIKFTGWISDLQLKEKLTKARILVQPSLYEGFGLPPLQALCSGTNAVISDIPVFKEIYKEFPVTYFETGNSEDLKNKMLAVWNNPEPENIPKIYSFEKTAALILQVLLKYKK